MKNYTVDIVIIGAGPAGLAAALEAKKLGTEKVLVIERDVEAGGILQQCIHDGFGLHRFQRRMSGPEYAQMFMNELAGSGVEIKFDTMVMEITKDHTVYACSQQEGMMKIEAGAVILAMGCRERTASQVLIYGYRPAGVLTAGTVQRYINIEGYLPGKKAVILGSGDIGLIMARRMTLENIKVQGVYEVMEQPGGLTRNIVQCLDDYNIPLHLATTVTKVHGKKRIEGVTVAKVDSKRQVIPGTEEYIECDLLVLAVGLIPENELSIHAGIEIDKKTKGPVLDNNFMTSVPGIFAAGNVAVVFDLVDYVSQSGEIAARGAVKYIKGKLKTEQKYYNVHPEGNINFIVPQKILSGEEGEAVLFMRVKKPDKKVSLRCMEGKTCVKKKNFSFVAPPEMIQLSLETSGSGDLTVDMEEGKQK